jgi:hypothetical protein
VQIRRSSMIRKAGTGFAKRSRATKNGSINSI